MGISIPLFRVIFGQAINKYSTLKIMRGKEQSGLHLSGLDVLVKVK